MITNFQIGIDPNKSSMLLNTKNEPPKLYLKNGAFMLNSEAVYRLKLKLNGKDKISFIVVSDQLYLVNSKNLKLDDIGKCIVTTGGKFSFAPMHKILKKDVLDTNSIEHYELIHEQQVMVSQTVPTLKIKI